ncbi:MAG: DUF58 domain-containing protein [Clostridia bacterium]|nr:DUF58 domain-containing protein [Clostridia bacterium]
MRKSAKSPDSRLLKLTPRVWIYPILLLSALLFAQALKMSVSYMVFLFVLLLPLTIILQLLCARHFINVAVRCDSETAEKGQPLTMTAIFSNACILPFAFVEAELLVSDERGARTVPRRYTLALAPCTGCEINQTVRFAFRGEYLVGIRCLYVYDCFRTIRIRVDAESYASLFVLPRRITFAPRPIAAESELNTQTVIRAIGSDNTELSDIRTYESGDSLKRIHWKLSSKGEELLVKEYSRNNGNHVYVFSDLETHYAKISDDTEPDLLPPLTPLPEYADVIDELNADLTVEHCLAAVQRELWAANEVTLSWFARRPMGDDYEEMPVQLRMVSPSDLNMAWRRFAVAPLTAHDKQASALSSLASDTTGSSLIFVTACLDASAVAEYTRIAGAFSHLGAHAVELIYCADTTLYTHDDAADAKIARYIAQLSGAGITVYGCNADTFSSVHP